MRVAEPRDAHAPLVLRAKTAADLMVPNPISLRAEADLSEAAMLFSDKRITAAPVIDEAGRPIGVVSRSDLFVHHCEHERQSKTMPDYFVLPGLEMLDSPRDASANVKVKVADIMTPAVFAVSPDTPASGVIGELLGLHVHRLFVVDADGALVGVISTMDVLKALKH